MQLHHIGWLVAGICALLAFLVICWVVFNHLLSYASPAVQRPMVRILIMVPVYAIDSWLSLVFKDYAQYFDLARDCYEAYVLYTFLSLLVGFMGGEATLVCALEEKPPCRVPIPFCCFRFKPGSHFYHRAKQMILQFVLVRPLCSFATVLFLVLDIYGEGSFAPNRGYLYITIINNVSITVAMYYLVMFYEALAEDLKPFRPVAKFLCVKAVIFFAFWQGVAIAILAHFGVLHDVGKWTSEDVARGLQDFIICVEMLPMSLAFAYAFGARSFLEPDSTHLLSEIEGLGNVLKNYRELQHNFAPVMQNFRDVADVRDVLGDTYRSFAQGPRRHVVAADFLSLSPEEQLLRVVKQGWLMKGGTINKLWKKRWVVFINNPWGILYYEKSPFISEDDDATDSDDELAMRMQKRAKLLAKKVLIKDMDEHHENQRRPLAFIDLTNVSKVVDTSRRGLLTFWRVENTFCLVTVSTGRIYTFLASSPHEVAEWKAALEQGLEAMASAPDALAHADSDLEASFDEDSINYGSIAATTITTI